MRRAFAQRSSEIARLQDDVVDCMLRASSALQDNRTLPPMKLASGIATSLKELAAMAVAESDGQCRVVVAPSREGSVARYVGDATLAAELLDWRATTSLEGGFRDLASQYRRATKA